MKFDVTIMKILGIIQLLEVKLQVKLFSHKNLSKHCHVDNNKERSVSFETLKHERYLFSSSFNHFLFLQVFWFRWQGKLIWISFLRAANKNVKRKNYEQKPEQNRFNIAIMPVHFLGLNVEQEVWRRTLLWKHFSQRKR